GLAALDRTEEVGDAQERCHRLARERKAHPLGRAALVLPEHDVVPLAVRREVAVDDLRHQHPRCLGLGQLLAQDRPDAGLERVVLLYAAFWPELPLVAE